MKKCPRCEFDLEKKKVDVAEVEVQEYVRCTLAGRAYRKNYALYNGELKMLFQELTVEKADCMRKVIATLNSPEDKMKVKVLFYLAKYNDTQYENFELNKPKEYYLGMCAKHFEDFNETLWISIVRTLTSFILSLRGLVDKGFDANFWKGAGLI